jgi:hypothetical protein
MCVRITLGTWVMDPTIRKCGAPYTSEPMQGGMTIRGRSFTRQELLQIRTVVEESPDSHRFAISKQVCEILDWRQRNGRLKDRACRDVLTRLHEIGFLRLPAPRRPAVRRQPIPITERTLPRPALSINPLEVDRMSFSIVTGCGDAEQERLWNEYVERYHYLGYGVPLGPHIKYFIHVRQEIIACLSFAGAAWRVEARDQWIGWSDEQRKRNLYGVVNNTRFVIFPWAEVPNLASRLLSQAARRLPDDWHRLYAYRPVLLETFVHAERFTGACYRAANWTLVGHTKGRGRMDRHFKANVAKKLVLLYPLVKHARERLRG